MTGKFIPDEKTIKEKGRMKNGMNICLDKGASKLSYGCHPESLSSLNQVGANPTLPVRLFAAFVLSCG